MSFLCRVGWHKWNRPRRDHGWRIRRCANCKARQVEQFPGPTWEPLAPVKRVRKPKPVGMLTEADERSHDADVGLEPL